MWEKFGKVDERCITSISDGPKWTAWSDGESSGWMIGGVNNFHFRRPSMDCPKQSLSGAVHFGPSEVSHPSTPRFPVLSPALSQLYDVNSSIWEHRTSFYLPLPASHPPIQHCSPGSPQRRWGEKKKTSVLEANADGIPLRMTASPTRLSPLPTFPPFRPSSCPTVLPVVFLSLLYRRTGRRGQIQSDLAMVCLGWLNTGPRPGSLLVLASRLSTRMQPCWSTLDFYNIAEYIQLAFFSSSPCGWCTRIRPTLVDQLPYIGLSPATPSIREQCLFIFHTHLWPFICAVWQMVDGSMVTVLDSLVLSFSLCSSTSVAGGLLSSCAPFLVSPAVSPVRYGMVGTVAGDDAPRSVSVVRPSGVCWTRPFSFTDSSLAGLRPFSLPMFHPAHALGVLLVALCCLLRCWLGFYLNWQLMTTVSLSLSFKQ